jgi:hypothetical protein
MITTKQEFYEIIKDKYNGKCPICNKKLSYDLLNLVLGNRNSSIYFTSQDSNFDYIVIKDTSFLIRIYDWRWNYNKKEAEYLKIYIDSSIVLVEDPVRMVLPYNGDMYSYLMPRDKWFDKIEKLQVLL